MPAKKPPGGGAPRQYLHKKAERKNNPHAGIATAKNSESKTKQYYFDPHLDPQLHWAGKNEKNVLEIDVVPLHVHERIDPLMIMEKMLRVINQQTLVPFFDQEKNKLPLYKAIDFYKHKHNWSNRLISGDSLLVMNSLLEKEGMSSKVQMVYIDPPYGIKYASNFQPFVSKQEVKETESDMSREPEAILAFRDTWELGIHSYLTYLRNKIYLARQLLTETGSCFVQISIDNLHLVRNVMDEIFGSKNFMSIISFRTKQAWRTKHLPKTSDYIVWYAKNYEQVKSNPLYVEKDYGHGTMYTSVELPDGTRRKMTKLEKENKVKIPNGSKIFRLNPLISPGKTKSGCYEVNIDGKTYKPRGNNHWKTTKIGMENLIRKKRIYAKNNALQFITYYDDLPMQVITNVWNDTQGATDKKYVVQTPDKVIQRCMLMTTDPGDLVFDPTCGSGTTAYVAEKFGRRWITCDTSRIATIIAKQRMITSVFDYYKLAHGGSNNGGVEFGFECEQIPHTTLGLLAKNEPVKTEELSDKPKIDLSKHRITGPFTVEAVPSPTVKSIDVLYDTHIKDQENGTSHQELGKHPQQRWRDELFNCGIRGRKKQKIKFSYIEAHPTSKWIHAIGETDDNPQRVAISFGPEHSPLGQYQVEQALKEALNIVPNVTMIIFAAMYFDPEASKNIDLIKWKNVTVLKAEINKDLLTEDLKKKQISNELFWLIGQPDVELKQIEKKYVAVVNGFDYYDIRQDKIISSDTKQIVMWMLDTDYDGRSIYPQQIFFPMKNVVGSDGMQKLSKTLCAELDDELVEKTYSTESAPFKFGENKKAAVKIVDDRGIESLKILELE